MGNVIVMAVRHADLDALDGIDFKSTQVTRHRGDHAPKDFSGDPTWLSKSDWQYEKSCPNILFSSYYHYSNAFCLYVDDHIMAIPGHLNRPIAWHARNEPFDFKSIVTKTRGDIRHNGLSLLSGAGKVGRKLREPGFKVSLFLLFTDCLHDAEKNAFLMNDVAEFCRSGAINARTFNGISGGIEPIGTLSETEAGLIVVKDVSATIHRLQRFQFEISAEEKQVVVTHLDNKEWRLGGDEADFLMTREISAIHGYTLSKKSKKVS